MAGGYGGKGLPLHARNRAGPVSQEGPAPACPVKHCWVTAPVDGGSRRPGLLLEWRRTPEGRWEGRVCYAAELRPGRWATVEEWLDSELLSTA